MQCNTFKVDDKVTVRFQVLAVSHRRAIGCKDVYTYLELLPIDVDGIVNVNADPITVRAEQANGAP